MKRLHVIALLMGLALPSCATESDFDGANTPDDAETQNSGVSDDAAADDASDDADDDTPDDGEAAKVGFEILEFVSPDEIVVWLGRDMTLEEFEALELPEGWFKNQPRESDPDGGSFARSPDAEADGEFTDAEHFGFQWRHNATVIEAGTPIDDEGLLRLNRVAKFHTVSFDAGKTIHVLASPEGTRYVRITRDADRTSDDPVLPSGWRIVAHTLEDDVAFDLPNPTENIRCDNEDSFQGPVPELDDLVEVPQP
jgi:hypothetical protein